MARRLKPRAVVHQQKMTAGQMLFSFVPRNEPETVLHPSRLHALSVRGLIRACFRDNALFSFSLCFVMQISRGNMTSSGCLNIFSD